MITKNKYSFFITKGDLVYTPNDEIKFICNSINEINDEIIKNNVITDIKISKDAINTLKNL